MSSNSETSISKVNVENLNKPKQTNIDESKKQLNNKLKHIPKLTNNPLYECELENDQISLSTSNETILIYDETKFRLFNSKLEQINELIWKEYDSSGILTIDDITYLSCQNSYLILTRSYIYELNIDKFNIELINQFSKKDKSDEEKIDFSSITAHDEHVFISYVNGLAITKWIWKPAIQLVNRWTKTKIIDENDKNILSIRTNGTHVALLIQTDSNIHLNIYDFNLSTRIVENLELNKTGIMLTSLDNNQWLIIDSEQRELLLINEDNQIEKTQNKNSLPINASRLGNDYLVVKCHEPNKLQIFKFD